MNHSPDDPKSWVRTLMQPLTAADRISQHCFKTGLVDPEKNLEHNDTIVTLVAGIVRSELELIDEWVRTQPPHSDQSAMQWVFAQCVVGREIQKRIGETKLRDRPW